MCLCRGRQPGHKGELLGHNGERQHHVAGRGEKAGGTRPRNACSRESIQVANGFAERGLDFIGLQETRLQTNADSGNDEYRIFGSAATPQGHGGVQLWVRKALRAELLETRPLSERILMVVMRIRKWVTVFAVAHAPIDGSAEAEDFFNHLGEHIYQAKRKHSTESIVILADFNAKVGEITTPEIGPHSPASENQSGAMLRFFAHEHSVILQNTWFPESSGWTWAGTRGHKSRVAGGTK